MSLRSEKALEKILETLAGISWELNRLNNFLEEQAVTVALHAESKLYVDVNNTVFTASAE
ncbi:hypothetical protein EBZ39_14425 [bacterium]|nr:hypothetical protein [bacterium]